MENLDLKDRKILYYLDINSRQSNSDIAKKVGLSKEVVNYRIKRLEKEGIIKGYYTVLDFYKLGYISVRVYLKLIDTSPKKEGEIIDFLVKSRKVFFVFKADGYIDIGFGTWVKNIYEFESFYLEFKKNFKEYIGKDFISIFTKAHHFHRAYLLEKEKDEIKAETVGREKEEDYDTLDLEILKLLAKNAKIETIEIAEKLNIAAKTAAFRIKQLEKKKIIQAYRHIFDFEKFNYEYFKVDLNLKDIKRIPSLITFCYLNPNIIYIDETIGGSDFEFDVEINGKKEFLELMSKLRNEFPEIRDWTYFTVQKYNKLLYFPED